MSPRMPIFIYAFSFRLETQAKQDTVKMPKNQTQPHHLMSRTADITECHVKM